MMSNIRALWGVIQAPRGISGTAFPQVGHVFAFMPVKMRLTLAKVKSMGEFTTEGDFADERRNLFGRRFVRAGRFVEVENGEGKSIRFGQWMQRADGYWVLR